MKTKRKGISPFIAVMLMIAVTVGAFFLIYGGIKPVVETPLVKVEKATKEIERVEEPSLVISEINVSSSSPIKITIKIYNNGGIPLTDIRLIGVDIKGNYHTLPPVIERLDPGYIGYLTAEVNMSFVKFIITTAEGIKKEVSWENKIPITLKNFSPFDHKYVGVEVEIVFPAGVNKSLIRVLDSDGNEVPSFVEFKDKTDLTKEGEKAIIYFEASNVPSNGTKIYYVEYNKRPPASFPDVRIYNESNLDLCVWGWCGRKMKEGISVENKKIKTTFGTKVWQRSEFPYSWYWDWRGLPAWQMHIDGSKQTTYTFWWYIDPTLWGRNPHVEEFIDKIAFRFGVWNRKPGHVVSFKYMNVSDGKTICNLSLDFTLGYGYEEWRDVWDDNFSNCIKGMLNSQKILQINLTVTPDSYAENNFHLGVHLEPYLARWEVLNVLDRKDYPNQHYWTFGRGEHLYVRLYDNFGSELGYPLSARWEWYFHHLTTKPSKEIISRKNVIIIRDKSKLDHWGVSSGRWFPYTPINGSKQQVYSFTYTDFDPTNISAVAINFRKKGPLGSRVRFLYFKVGDKYYHMPELFWGNGWWGCDKCRRLYRYTFSNDTLPNSFTIENITLYVSSDDGVVCWLDGNEIGYDNSCHGRSYWNHRWNVPIKYLNLSWSTHLLACAVKERGGGEYFDADLMIFGTGFPERPFRLVPRLSEKGSLNSGWRYLQQTGLGDNCDPKDATVAMPTGWNTDPNFDDSAWSEPPEHGEWWWPWWTNRWHYYFYITPSFVNRSGDIPIEFKVSSDSYMPTFRFHIWNWVKRALPIESLVEYQIYPNTDYVKVKWSLTNKGTRAVEIDHMAMHGSHWPPEGWKMWRDTWVGDAQQMGMKFLRNLMKIKLEPKYENLKLNQVLYHWDYPDFSGWSDNRTSVCGEVGMMGGYNIFGSGASTSITLNLPPGKYAIGFNFHKIDSWDWEWSRLWVNDTQIWATRWRYDWGTNICGGGSRDMLNNYYIATFEWPGGTAAIKFDSTLNQEASDESWGVSNITIWNASWEYVNLTSVILDEWGTERFGCWVRLWFYLDGKGAWTKLDKVIIDGQEKVLNWNLGSYIWSRFDVHDYIRGKTGNIPLTLLMHPGSDSKDGSGLWLRFEYHPWCWQHPFEDTYFAYSSTHYKWNESYAIIFEGKRNQYNWFHTRPRGDYHWVSKSFRGTNALKPGETVTMVFYHLRYPNKGWDAPNYGFSAPWEYARENYLKLGKYPLKISVGKTYYYVS